MILIITHFFFAMVIQLCIYSGDLQFITNKKALIVDLADVTILSSRQSVFE